MEAINAIILSNIDITTKSKSLVSVVKERKNLLTSTIQLLIDNRCTELLETFLTDYEHFPKKRRTSIQAVSGYEWTHEQLDYFMICFTDTEQSNILCEHYELTSKANRFMNSNMNLTPKTVALGLTKESASDADTEFKRDTLFVVNVPSNESSVDDMMKTFLSEILSDRFLVKTRYDMPLEISSKKKMATADVIAVLFPQLYVGMVVVEDKPHDYSRSELQWDNAEAQTIAEAIAVMQQKHWPVEMPVFAMRVLGTFVTIYKLNFDSGFIHSVRKGAKRDEPFAVLRFLPDTIIPGQKPGWNLLDPMSRNTLINAVNDISLNIEATHSDSGPTLAKIMVNSTGLTVSVGP